MCIIIGTWILCKATLYIISQALMLLQQACGIFLPIGANNICSCRTFYQYRIVIHESNKYLKFHLSYAQLFYFLLNIIDMHMLWFVWQMYLPTFNEHFTHTKWFKLALKCVYSFEAIIGMQHFLSLYVEKLIFGCVLFIF